MGVHRTTEIDGYLVEFEPGEAWRCECGEFERAGICEHTLLSAALTTIERTLEESGLGTDVQFWASRRHGYRS